VVIYLERGADLHVAQLMPLPLTVSCSSKIQIGFTFLVLAYPGCPGKEAVKWLYVVVVSNKQYNTKFHHITHATEYHTFRNLSFVCYLKLISYNNTTDISISQEKLSKNNILLVLSPLTLFPCFCNVQMCQVILKISVLEHFLLNGHMSLHQLLL